MRQTTLPELRQQRWREFLLGEDRRAEVIRRGDWVLGEEGFRLEAQALQGRGKPRRRGWPRKAAVQPSRDLFRYL